MHCSWNVWGPNFPFSVLTFEPCLELLLNINHGFCIPQQLKTALSKLLFVKRATHRNTRIYHGEFIFRLLSLHTSSCLRFCSSHSSAFDLQQIDLTGTFGKSHTTSRWWRSFVNAGKFFHWCRMGNGPCQKVENIVQLYENCLIKFILYPVDIRCFDRLFHTL